MSDESALLAAIRANPDEETPRLAYADWLDEHATTDAQRGRAELIRTQCESHHTDQSDRIGELIERFGAAWVAGFPHDTKEPPFFSRGFLSWVRATVSDCLKLPRPPWYREPFVSLDLSGTVTDAKKLVASGWLNGVWRLGVTLARQTGGDAFAAELADSECAASLRELTLWNERFTDKGLRALANGRFTELCDLSLMGRFTAAGLDGVFKAPACARLNDVTLGHHGPWQPGQSVRPGPALADVLAAAPCAPHLKKLWLSDCEMGDEGLTRLVSCGQFPKLDWLHLGHDSPGAAFGRALARAKLPALRELLLGSCNISDSIVAALAKGPLMAQIEELELTLNELTAVSGRALARSNRCGALKNLNIGFNNLGDEGVRALVTSRKFPKMKSLHIDSNDLTDAGADTVLISPWVGELEQLGLGYNQISDDKRAECVRKFGSKVWFNDD
jgi:uncharacterized protein (TIGR02996 family)